MSEHFEVEWTSDDEFEEDDEDEDATKTSIGWNGRVKRVYSEMGFRFLTPPWWFKMLHLFKSAGKRQAVWTRLAHIAYWLSRDPSKCIYKDSRMMRLAVKNYPLYFLFAGSRTQLKRLWGILIILAILGIPFTLGYLVGAVHHISITIK